MKKLVLVVAMFMFVCGGSFLVKAQSSAEAVTAPTEINATVVNDTVVKDTVTKEDAPAKASLVALAANVNDTVVTDTTSTVSYTHLDVYKRQVPYKPPTMGVSPYEKPVLKIIARLNTLLTKEAAPSSIVL